MRCTEALSDKTEDSDSERPSKLSIQRTVHTMAGSMIARNDEHSEYACICVHLLDSPEDRAKTSLESIKDCTRDPDVLDTWFSSALWPFSTLGWPEETPELKTFYPGDVLCTAREIITLWVSPHGDDGPVLRGRHPLPRCVHPRDDPGRRGPQDVQEPGQRHRPAGSSSTATGPTRCGSRWPA